MNDLKASPEVMNAVSILRAEIERIWELAWRITFDVVKNGCNHDELVAQLDSNPVFASLFIEMQRSASTWIECGISVDKIPPIYSVTPTKLKSLFLEVTRD